jgi:hypothetical protein
LFLCSKVYQGVYTHVSIFEAYAFVASAWNITDVCNEGHSWNC